MNKYELALYFTNEVLNEWHPDVPSENAHIAEQVVQRLVDNAALHSNIPGDLIPNGLEDGVHKAAPMITNHVGEATCRHCGTPIKTVPGGSGPTWAHITTGAVAGTGAPRDS